MVKFFSDIPVDVEDNDTGYLETESIPAQITKIVKVEKSYTLVGLRDFRSKDIVALIRGKKRPNRDDVGSVSMFALSGQTKNGEIKFAGFFNSRDDLPKEVQGRKPKADSSGGQSGGGGRSGNVRGFALSYAKDLAVAGVINLGQIRLAAKEFEQYLETGEFPKRPEPVPDEYEDVPEVGETEYEDDFEDIPF